MRCVLRCATCTPRPLLPSSLSLPRLVLCPPFIILFVWKSVWPTSKPKLLSFSTFTVMTSVRLFTCLHSANDFLYEIHLTSLNELEMRASCPSFVWMWHVGVPLSFPFYLGYHSRPKASLIVKWTSQTELKKALTSSSRKVPPLHFVGGTLSLRLCWFAINYILTDGENANESIDAKNR